MKRALFAPSKFALLSTGVVFFTTMYFVFAMSLHWYQFVYGATCTSSATGNWETAGTWSCGQVPTSADDVTIVSGHTVTITGTSQKSVASLTVNSGGTLTHSAQTDIIAPWAETSYIDIVASGNITIAGTVDANAKGYAGGVTPANGSGPGGGGSGNDATSVDDGSGGGHGGAGGDDGDSGLFVDAGGPAYCDSNDPSTAGSGGGGAPLRNGGIGGGLIRLSSAGSVEINGTVRANGGNGNFRFSGVSGGGAGGGIKIVGDTVSGSGSITANGGNSGTTAGANFDGGGGGGGCIYIGYTTSNSLSGSVTGGAPAAGGGSTGSVGTVVTEQIVDNSDPTVSTTTPAQNSASTVTFSTTIADSDLDETSLAVQYSLNNSAWSFASIGSVSVSEGSVTTSTGSVEGIDTDDDGSVDLTIEWDAFADVPGVDDTTVYLRITPNDGVSNGSVETSGSFALDTKNPTAPGALTGVSTSTTSIVLAFGSQTEDTNFTEYKIFYTAGSSGVTESDTAITSSTDPNLGSKSYNGASTTTITGLSINTQYVATMYVYDSFGYYNIASSEFAFYTMADTPATPVTAPMSTSSLSVTIDTAMNPGTVAYAICQTQDGASCASGGYAQVDGTLGVSAVWATSTEWGLVAQSRSQTSQ
jgi:hypothetical protein